MKIARKPPISSNPRILSGTPVIKGTRIPVTLVIDLVKKGYSLDLIQREYPSLTKNKLNQLLVDIRSLLNAQTLSA